MSKIESGKEVTKQRLKEKSDSAPREIPDDELQQVSGGLANNLGVGTSASVCVSAT